MTRSPKATWRLCTWVTVLWCGPAPKDSRLEHRQEPRAKSIDVTAAALDDAADDTDREVAGRLRSRGWPTWIPGCRSRARSSFQGAQRATECGVFASGFGRPYDHFGNVNYACARICQIGSKSGFTTLSYSLVGVFTGSRPKSKTWCGRAARSIGYRCRPPGLQSERGISS